VLRKLVVVEDHALAHGTFLKRALVLRNFLEESRCRPSCLRRAGHIVHERQEPMKELFEKHDGLRHYSVRERLHAMEYPAGQPYYQHGERRFYEYHTAVCEPACLGTQAREKHAATVHFEPFEREHKNKPKGRHEQGCGQE
jgi:hypothetical protein